MTETPLASVFSKGKYVGAILSRGPKGYEAVSADNASHGCFPSQREAAAALQTSRDTASNCIPPAYCTPDETDKA
jgi:hypothetical protein